MNKIMIILRKEWLEIRQQRLLLFSTLFPPLLLTLLPLIVLYAVTHGGSQMNNTSSIAGLSSSPLYADMSTNEIMQVIIGMQMSILYLLIPGLLTSIIASYSIVGEKSGRTLEPLLATPIRTWELLVGKCLSALLPGLLITWLSGGIFIAGLAVMASSSRVFFAIISPGWLILFFVWSPLLALIAIAVMVAVSARVNDVRTAQQFSAWIVVPFLGVFFSQIAGIQVLGVVSTLIIAAFLFIIAIAAIWAITALFQREVILTRWK